MTVKEVKMLEYVKNPYKPAGKTNSYLKKKKNQETKNR